MRRAGLTLPTLLTALALAACGKSPASHEATAAPAIDAGKAALLATLPAAYQHADLDNGEAKVALCKSCHSLETGGGNGVGPNLHGVFGRKAGSLAGFSYSDGLKATGIVWDAGAIDRWIANPRAVVPATKMTYIGMEDAKDRADVVAYLKVKTSG